MRKYLFFVFHISNGVEEMGIFDKFLKPSVKKMEKKRDVEGLIKVLEDFSIVRSIRMDAARALGRLRDARAVKPLIKALKDGYSFLTFEYGDEVFRRTAIEALVRIDEPAVEPLIQDLKDKYSHVREGAVEVLGNIGEPAIDPLIQALRHKEWRVRTGAAIALGNIGDARAVETLTHTLKHEDSDFTQALKHEDSDVREWAAEALHKVGWKPRDDTEKAHYLIAKREWDELVRVGKPAVEPLTQALRDRYSFVRDGAARALGKIGDTKAVEHLIPALKDEDSDVRGTAARTLGKIGDAKAVEPLTQALKDKDALVRATAEGALEKIRAKKS